MKRNLLLISALVIFSFAVKSQDNSALTISNTDTWFTVAGLAETLITDCTMEGWVKIDPAATIADYCAMIDFRDAGNSNSKALIFKTLEGNLTTSYEWHGDWGYEGASNIVVPGEWQHIAFVISSADMETRFYVNGVQTGSDNTYANIGVEQPLGENVRVGSSNNMAERTLVGAIDEVRVWTVARTAEEIAANMTHEIDPATEGLLAYYQCNELLTSTTLTDVTGNGFDLAPVDLGTNYMFLADGGWVSSISDLKDAVSITTYPNPAKDVVHFRGIELKNADMRIFDVTGRLIAKKVLSTSSVNVASLETGLYFIEVKQGKDLYKSRFIKD